MSDRLIIPRPDDFHVHLRQGQALRATVSAEALWFGRAMVMPNTSPPVSTTAGMILYRAEITAQASESRSGKTSFEPLMTFKILPGMDRQTVMECARAGAVAGKYYPAGSTTNASDGPADPDQAAEALETMEEAGIVLSIHAEDPSAPVLEREAAFLPVLERIMRRHPRIRVVFEHVSSAEGLGFVLSGPHGLAATVTPHHLLFSIDDVMGDSLNPHLYCKPVIKSRADRDALREAVFSRNPRLFFGSDSAPHPRKAKECARSASGVFSAPTAIPALAGLFERCGALDAFGGFVGAAGAAFYGLPAPTGTIELIRKKWTAPDEVDGFVPMLAGADLEWRLSEPHDS